MRLAGLVALTWAAIACWAGPAIADAHCLSSGEATAAVGARQVVAPARAVSAARRAVPDGDVLRALLCDASGTLTYRVTMLRHDGRLVRVLVDAPSGTVR